MIDYKIVNEAQCMPLKPQVHANPPSPNSGLLPVNTTAGALPLHCCNPATHKDGGYVKYAYDNKLAFPVNTTIASTIYGAVNQLGLIIPSCQDVTNGMYNYAAE
jgi:hypothetical protein